MNRVFDQILLRKWIFHIFDIFFDNLHLILIPVIGKKSKTPLSLGESTNFYAIFPFAEIYTAPILLDQ